MTINKTELRKRLIADYGMVCQVCGFPPIRDESFLEVDKVGDGDTIDNYALFCGFCDVRKWFGWSFHELRAKRYKQYAGTTRFRTWWETVGKIHGGFYDGRQIESE